MNATDPFEVLSDALGSRLVAAEYHGALCGALSVLPLEQVDPLRVLTDDILPVDLSPARALLECLRDQTLDALRDEAMGFMPLLPDDEVALAERTQALSHWCQGFLWGLASHPGFNLDQGSEDLREVVKDLVAMTHVIADDDADSDLEVEETAYTELLEYVRVGVQLVFMELHPRPTLDPATSQHLH